MITTELINALKNDSELFEAYKANIAMAFKDEFDRYYDGTAIASKTKDSIHKIANNAAKNFLNNFIGS